MIQQVGQLLRSAPGCALSTAADSLRITRQTFYNWMNSGKTDPDRNSLCARFFDEVQAALADAEISLIRAVEKTSPQFILSRRYPSRWPSERQLLEISGPGGAPLEPPRLNIVVQSQ